MLESRPANIDYQRQVSFEEVVALHKRCGIYTNEKTVCSILDAIGWIPTTNLSRSRLLEPAAGNGVFVGEAARRLVASLEDRRVKPTVALLAPRITAFELHPSECESARSKVEAALCSVGVHRRTAESCA